LFDGKLGDVKKAFNVRGEKRLEVVGGEFRERLGEEDAGVIDECVD
jgi:hypothetical protein